MMNKEQYLLIKLMEECSELQKECSKALTFGMLSTPIDPPSNITNYDSIVKELHDVYGIIDVMRSFEILPQEVEYSAIENKIKRTHKYMQVSKNLGILE